jgi:hypothetical protein
MVRNIISERESELPVSTIGRLIAVAAEDKKVISLGPGEPDFDSPKNVIRAAKRALDAGYTHYSPPAGRRELREAIARKLKKDNRVKTSPVNNRPGRGRHTDGPRFSRIQTNGRGAERHAHISPAEGGGGIPAQC